MTLGSQFQFLAFIIDRINSGVVIIDRDMRIQLWNQFMESHTGRSQTDLMEQNLFEAFPELPKRWLEKKINSVFLLKNFAFTSWEQRPFLFRMPHNRPVTGGVEFMQQDCTLMPLKGADGEVEYICITIQDATDVSIYQSMLKEAMRKLEQSSRIDGLTQIYNRTHWEQRLSEEFDRVQRYGGELALIMFDLDKFKSINDNYGHLAGDEVLRHVSALLRAQLRSSDVGGRYGGEEFGIILPNTNMDGAMLVAERLRKSACAEPVPVDDNISIPISISLGITQVNPLAVNHEKLIEQADTALYHSKRNGRNRSTSFLSLQAAAGSGSPDPAGT